jgi:hypothetical protein
MCSVAGGACNTGALESRGSILLFLDSDHWIEPVVADRLFDRLLQIPDDKQYCYHLVNIDSEMAVRPADIKRVFMSAHGNELTVFKEVCVTRCLGHHLPVNERVNYVSMIARGTWQAHRIQ